jgi:hypothetical protein
MSKPIKVFALFVVGIAIMFGLFAIGHTLFGQYYLAILIASGLLYFVLLYVIENIALTLLHISLRNYIGATMVAPMLLSAIGLILVELISGGGSFSASSFADLAWALMLSVTLVISGVALAVRVILQITLKKKKQA